MLVLSRHNGESLMIGDEIEITIVEIQGDKVRIGINAPKSIAVLRSELVREAGSVNAEAASPDVDLQSLAGMLKKK